MTMTVTNVDIGSVVLRDARFRDDTFTAAGAATFKEGTILARKEVADAVVVAADGGNTGDGTVTAASVVEGPVVPLVGAYNLEAVATATNGGTFKLEDPNGALVEDELVMTAGAGAATTFELGGLTFTITDGGTDFAVGDKFTLTVAADGKLVVFSPTGAGGAQIPKRVLTHELVTTGAGDVAIRALMAGSVRKERLVIDADGDDSNVDATVIDQLQDASIIAEKVTDLSVLDNQ